MLQYFKKIKFDYVTYGFLNPKIDCQNYVRWNYCKAIKAIIVFVVFVILLSSFTLDSYAQQVPNKVVNFFMEQINTKNYKKAYSTFSHGLQQEVSFDKFKNGFRRVVMVHILNKKVVEANKEIVRIKLEVLTKEWEEGKLYKRKYKGSVVLVPEKNNWKFIQVILDNAHGKRIVKG